jgi:hypothetical protein
MQRLKARLAASDQEYRAALNGVSIFFGAVLGVEWRTSVHWRT